jgi:hypothetical protein
MQSAAAAAAAAVAAAAANASPEKEPADSWDSVTQQPFCDVCQMAFKSIVFLERHTKYSDLHAKNVARKEGKDVKDPLVKEPAPAPVPEPVVEEAPAAQALPAVQVEGKDYKLLYTGSKFFWRTSKNIDVDMYLHIVPHVIEVISFDPDKHKEASRIYVNYFTIESLLQEIVNIEFEAQMKEFKLEDRFFSLPNEAEYKEKMMVQRTITYILQRLQLDAMGTHGEMLYVQQYGDADYQTPLLDAPPATLVPVNLTRRRKTSTEEINDTMRSFNAERAALGEAINNASSYSSKSPLKPTGGRSVKVSPFTLSAKADKVTGIMFEAIKYMSSKKWYNEVSVPKRRFIRAARMIIRQNLAVKTREALLKRNFMPSPSGKYARKTVVHRPREV